MSKPQWKPSKDKLFGYAAIELKHAGSKELTLASKRGEIWAYSDTQASVLCLTSRIAIQVLKVLQVRRFRVKKTDSERVFRVPAKLVPQIVKVLRIPKTRPAQARAANSFK